MTSPDRMLGQQTLSEVFSCYPAESTPSTNGFLSDKRGSVLVVLDDDPTGTQSVANIPVLMRWGVADFLWAFGQERGAVYVETNSRALEGRLAEQVTREVVHAALEAGRRGGRQLVFISRGDSTLRGHYPLETDAMIAAMREAGQPPVDAVIIVPAFPQAGRVTIGAKHWIRDGSTLIPVADTEYARDPTFGYSTSDLPLYVQEKSGGRIRATEVVTLTLDIVRSGSDAIVEALSSVHDAATVVADAVSDDDLASLAQGLSDAEQRGKNLLYRVAPPFVRAMLGQPVRVPLTAAEVFPCATIPGVSSGLVVVGSHVPLTSRQLEHLHSRRHMQHIELDVNMILGDQPALEYLAQLADDVVDALRQGDVVLSTSRRLLTGKDAKSSLEIAGRVSDALVGVVAAVTSRFRPRFVIAKGGITSSQIISASLGATRALIRGPMRPGIISLWELIDGPFAGVPYIVFAGNTGADEDLTRVVETLSAYE